MSSFDIMGKTVASGSRAQVDLPVSRLPDGGWLALPVAIVHGTRPGKSMYLSAAIHGDELNGIEIIRSLLARLKPEDLAGTLLALPMVNVFGVLQQSRYLPDRRDLNRSFPGSKHGSLASRLAHLLLREVVMRCNLGIDFHTGSNGRTNLPQIRITDGDRRASQLASAFGAPVVLHGANRRGSLRWAAAEEGIPNLVYEAGEALRFDEAAIRLGVDGTLRIMREVGMLRRAPKPPPKPLHCRQTRWMRAKAGGICRTQVTLGARVRQGDTLAVVVDAFNHRPNRVKAPRSGVVIGLTTSPLVNSGDALVHLASVTR